MAYSGSADNALTSDITNLPIADSGEADNFVQVDHVGSVEAEDPTRRLNSSPPSGISKAKLHSKLTFTFYSSPSTPSTPTPRVNPLEQVLHNEDLLHLIFSFLHPHLDRWTFRRQSSLPLVAPKSILLPVALTCKAFFLPAMRVLWFESSILSLLRVIPVLVRRGKTYILNGVITEAHMQRVDLYASCIRRLHSATFNVKVSSQVFTILSRLRFPTLLPFVKQLKFLSIHNMPLENLNSLFLIKSPTLADIQIGRIDGTSEVLVASFLNQVATHVETLDLKGRLTEVTFGVLPKFERLTMLFVEVQPVQSEKPVDFLGCCAQIATLEVLWLSVHPEYRYTGTTTAAVEFSSLFSLIIAAPVNPMMDILGVFRTVQLPRLGSIRLNFRPTELSLDPRLSPCLERCVQIAHTRASPLALMLEGSITARWADLVPLRELKKVVGLHILFEALSVVNDDVERFLGPGGPAGRWGMLKKLIISYCNTPLAPNALSWTALGVIARSCQRLVSLVVSIRVETEAETVRALQREIKDGQSKLESSVISLTIHTAQHFDESQPRGSYSVLGAAVVSRYIYHCFPNLKEIKLRDPSNLDWCSGVERMVMSYQEIRESRI